MDKLEVKENKRLEFLENLKKRIEEQTARLRQIPMEILQQYQQQLDDLIKDLAIRMTHLVDITRSGLENLWGRLSALNPFAVLQRGYSITTKIPTKKALKDVKSVKIGDRVKTRLRKGEFISKVEKIATADDADEKSR